MKERIVIDRDNCVYIKAKYGYREQYEQVPETFEELKELIKQTVKEDDHNGIKKGFGSIEYILIDDKSFLPTGEILDEDNDVFAVNRTPAQMWQIIKNLIGE